LTAPRVLWRVSSHSDLAGLGGEKTDGRWHTAARGKRFVYLSEHPALALIEALANLQGDPKLFPDTYQLIKVTVAGNVSMETLAANLLSIQWRENLPETRSTGDAWLAKGRSALLAVPSAPSPESLNFLFNPLHGEARRLAVEWHKRIAWDKRLFHAATQRARSASSGRRSSRSRPPSSPR
jgi:RES domain-containing protein